MWCCIDQCLDIFLLIPYPCSFWQDRLEFPWRQGIIEAWVGNLDSQFYGTPDYTVKLLLLSPHHLFYQSCHNLKGLFNHSQVIHNQFPFVLIQSQLNCCYLPKHCPVTLIPCLQAIFLPHLVQKDFLISFFNLPPLP